MHLHKDIPFIGTGWSFPPEFSKGKRGVEIVNGVTDINQSLELLLSTRPGERYMNPNYGCDLSIMLFEIIDNTLLGVVEDTIKLAVSKYEPRIFLDNINFSIDSLNGTVFIDLQYTIKTTNTRSNIVYPFYLNEATNI